jgi:hypothetical protein
MTDEMKKRIWQVLVEECGASAFKGGCNEMFWSFRFHWPECREFRFIGKLGFGGKVWDTGHEWRVSCYSENLTPERDAMIERANARLAELRRTYAEAA